MYEHDGGHQTVMISDVQEPNSFVGWRYLVRAINETNEQLGLAEYFEAAKERTTAFMVAYEQCED